MELTFTVDDYDRIRPLATGEVSSDRFDLHVENRLPGGTFLRVAGGEPFDITEMSLSTFTLWKSKGTCPHVGIPVFPSRFFRHSNIFVHEDAGIDEPADLRGADVGIHTEYQMTMGTMARGMLQHEYDVHPHEMTWYADREEKIDVNLPEGVEKEVIAEDDDLHDLLAEGEIDALISYLVPDAFGRNVERLFPDFRRVEMDYYERTGIFPIMHMVMVNEDLYDDHPWIAEELFSMFVEAKEAAVERLYDHATHRVTLPWTPAYVEEARSVFGGDFWPYGFEANREELEAICQYTDEQGLSDRRVSPEELFVDELLDT